MRRTFNLFHNKNLEKEIAKSRKFALERYRRLSKEFEFSNENVAKISALNDMLSKKMQKLFDEAISLCEIFLELQDEGHDDFYEYAIHGEISFSDLALPTISDEDAAEKICEAIDYSNEQFALDINYAADFFNVWAIKKRIS